MHFHGTSTWRPHDSCQEKHNGKVSQVLSPDQARRVLRHVSQVVEPGGSLYILGNVRDNSRLSPLEPRLSHLFYVNVFDEGQAYTDQEYRDWIADAGFEPCERLLLPNNTSMVRARKSREGMTGTHLLSSGCASARDGWQRALPWRDGSPEHTAEPPPTASAALPPLAAAHRQR
jgi:hypothetical protein